MMNKERKKRKSKVTLTTNDAIHVFDEKEIVCCKGTILSSEIYQLNGNVVRVNLPLDKIEEALNDETFWRTGENDLINLNYLINVSGDGDQSVLMVNQYSIPIQEHRKTMLLKALSKL